MFQIQKNYLKGNFKCIHIYIQNIHKIKMLSHSLRLEQTTCQHHMKATLKNKNYEYLHSFLIKY